ncbi:ankyrin repeat-containing domain protein [Halenospora varia]|nr:ankyrin repeat-containing domain protein [Halenospora varia]
MSLVELANETLLTIVGYLTRESDTNAFTQTNRQLYFATNSYLYQFAINRGNNAGLRIASTLGNYSLVHMLLEMGANPRSTPRESTHVTALHFAAAEGHLQIVDDLIQAGANVNAVTSNVISPLHEAVLSSFIDVVRLLLDNGADPLIRFPKANRATVLHLASH